MKELVEYIARNLVDNPDAVNVRETRGDYVVRIQLTVDPDEKGKVIGREGKIARAIRTLVNAAAAREGRRGVLEIE
ncbi:MAG: KH domain-containing protein [Chloroflexi bacterium]|nr:KH domain-containing protein [Chloroflexota bacterium]